MGQRAFLIKQQALAEIFQNRGPGWGAVVRIGGQLMPADARLCGMLFMPPEKAWALIYESPTWPEDTLIVPGARSNKVNGVTIVDGSVCHLRIVSNIATNPLCQVTELDGIVAMEEVPDRDPAPDQTL